MKLLALRGGALASLAEPFEIDFRGGALNASGLFAVTGPTGAGKSTLLDALCLALYGELPRLAAAGKNAAGLEPGLSAGDPRSALRQGLGEGFAEVDFLGRDPEGHSKRRAFRARCEIRRARSKPGGAIQPLRMRLFDLESGAPISDKLTETKAAIAERVGLSFEQFKRSALLAQGEFEAFLAADPKDRALLLERITGAEIFGRVSQAAHLRKREEEQAVAALQEQASAHRPLSQEDRAAAEEQEKTAKTALAEAQQRREALAAIGRFWREADRLTTERNEAVAEQQRSLAIFRGSARAAAKRLETEAAETEHRLGALRTEEAKSPWGARLADQEAAAKAALQTTTDAGAVLRALKTRKQELEETLEKSDRSIAELQRALTEQTRTAAPLQKKADEARAALAAIEPERVEAKATTGRRASENLSQLAAPIAEWRLTSETIAAANARSVQAKAENEQAKAELEEIAAGTPALQESVAEARARLESWRAALSESAEALRANLTQGEPCPVCGARDHAVAALTRAAQNAASEEEQRLAEAEKKLAKALERRGAAAGQAENSAKALTDAGREAKENTARREKALAAARAALDVWPELAKALSSQNLVDAAQSLNAALASGDISAAEDARQTLSATAEARLREIDRDVANLKSARMAAEKADKAVRQASADAARMQEAMETARAEKETLRQSLAELDAQAGEAREARAGGGATLDNLLKGFLDDWRDQPTKAIVARIREEIAAAKARHAQMQMLTEAAPRIEAERNALAELVSRKAKEGEAAVEAGGDLATEGPLTDGKEAPGFSEASAASEAHTRAQARAETAKQTLARRLAEPPEGAMAFEADPASLEKAQHAAEGAATAAQNAWEAARLTLHEDDAARSRLGAAEKALAKRREEAEVWLKLDELIGSSDGSKFRKFAQSLTLRSLAALASRRLRHLAPRYALEVAASNPTDPDLSLVAIDRDMGDARRPVRQLSGGERFLTSLALALALADLSSEQGVVVDSLFIDEGFGALDADSLGMALSALEALQATGRQIGVVTHVEALSEQIAARIEVVPLGGGRSRVRVAGPS